ncbi:uncharacterized protein LOC127256628 [Andrographis paniculata]|uniref:uncharacterized protein LOC127256628 n=1 Tax=Andrographis paniculata TaxID=175694 RepID=UPI0021E83B63|nr:uncharacterized protein LOC127256628 [Andrographis paniculata]
MFMNLYRWDAMDEGNIQTLFERKGSQILPRALRDARKKLKMPQWVKPELHACMIIKFTSPESLKIRERNVENKNKNKDALLNKYRGRAWLMDLVQKKMESLKKYCVEYGTQTTSTVRNELIKSNGGYDMKGRVAGLGTQRSTARVVLGGSSSHAVHNNPQAYNCPSKIEMKAQQEALRQTQAAL